MFHLRLLLCGLLTLALTACGECPSGQCSSSASIKPASTDEPVKDCCKTDATLADAAAAAAKSAAPVAAGNPSPEPAADTKDKPAAPAASAASAAPAVGDWPAADDREELVLDFRMLDQDGKPYKLAEMKGKATLITFLFTRCPDPNMCPLQAAKMAAMQKQAADAGLADKTNFLLISFDPAYDTPARLKPFGANQGVQFTNAKMLQPNPAEFPAFLQLFQLRVGNDAKGDLVHKTDLFLVDRQGRLIYWYKGMWDDKQVMEHLKKAAAEQ